MIDRARTSLRASPAQERFWLLEQLSAGASTQAIPLCIRLDGDVDPDRLADALRAVIARHEVLRSTYRWSGDELRADVRPSAAFEVEKIDARALPVRDEAAVVRFTQELAMRPFDLAEGPLLRAALVADGPERTFLVLVAHHIVWDGWSTAIVLRELAAAYRDGAASLPPLTSSYWDYADWRRSWIESADGEREVEFWRRRLGFAEQLAALVRPPAADGGPVPIHRRSVALDASLRGAIAACARASGTTPFGVVAASLQALIGETLDGDVSLGIVVADRLGSRWETLAGCFVNTVLLRDAVRGDDTFGALVARTRDASLEALTHAGMPFETMLERLGMRGDLDRVPPYQALLSSESFPASVGDVAGARATLVRAPLPHGRIEPVFIVALDGPEPMLQLQWNGELAIPDEGLLERWRALLEQGMERPDATLGGGARRPQPASATTVPGLVRASAARRPDAAALVDAEGTETYTDMLTRVAAIALRVRAAGAAPGMAVGIAAPRSAATVIATLAIQEAGCACMPLDLAYPAERLASMLEVAPPALILCDQPGGEWMGVPTLALDGSGEARAAAAAAARIGEDIAWIYFTSGSTGPPKGVLVSHASIVARLQAEPIDWEPDERGCHKSSMSYGDSIWETFAPLSQGVAVVVADDDAARDPRLLSRLVERHGVTRLLLVPALLESLLALPADALARLAGLRLCVATGEQLTGALAARFSRLLPHATLVNVYGATECWEVSWHVVSRAIRSHEIVPIGTELFEGVEVAVGDDDLRPLPEDTSGELLVAGPGVSRGYVGRPDLTAERFVDAPPGSGLHGIAYRTGDIVVARPGGRLELLGRRDRQVKLRGFRIELEEVERWLRASPAVREAAVVPQRDDAGTVVALAAFVVPQDGADVDPPALRRALGDQLPEHCLPGSWLRLTRLPLLSTGKVDRGALATLARCAPEPLDPAPAASADAPPGSDAERTLQEIWQEVLGVERVGVEDDFFDLGGSSLLAVQVVVRVEERLGAEVPLRDFYARPTIVGLSEALRA